MTYTPADLDQANRHVAEGDERIARLMANIVDAAQNGHPTDLAAKALATMRATMVLMLDHQRVIAEAVVRDVAGSA